MFLTAISSLTNKLMVRVTNYFDTQVRVPSTTDKSVSHLPKLYRLYDSCHPDISKPDFQPAKDDRPADYKLV